MKWAEETAMHFASSTLPAAATAILLGAPVLAQGDSPALQTGALEAAGAAAFPS